MKVIVYFIQFTVGPGGINRYVYFGIGTEQQNKKRAYIHRRKPQLKANKGLNGGLYKRAGAYYNNQDVNGPGGRFIGDTTGIRQRAIDALYRDHRFPNEPSAKEVLAQFDAPTGVGFQYGQLIWGWFIAPMDGEYTFFSSCDDECDVYLSPDQGKDKIRKIISQSTWSGHNIWDK